MIDINTITKFDSLKELLRAEILSGKFKAGERFYSDNNLGEKYNVSHVTSSKIIAVLTHEGLLTRVQGKGTFINNILPHISRKNKLPEGTNLGVVTYLDKDNPLSEYTISSEILKYFDMEAKGVNGRNILFNMFPVQRITAGLFREIKKSGIAGLAFRQSGPNAEDFKWIKRLKLPAVTLFCCFDNISSVDFDNWQIGHETASFLLKNGHKDIAFLLPAETKMLSEYELGWVRARKAGFLKAFEEAGTKPPGNCFMDIYFDFEKAVRKDIKNIVHKFSAVIICGDGNGAEFLAAANRMGIRVPDDISVVTISDSFQFRHLEFTSAYLSYRELSRTAFDLLSEKILRAGGSERKLVPCKMIERKTVKANN